jgi:hypothetical protein
MQTYRWGRASATKARPVVQMEELIRLHPPDILAVGRESWETKRKRGVLWIDMGVGVGNLE